MKVIIERGIYDHSLFVVSVYKDGQEVMSYTTDVEGVEEAKEYYGDHEVVGGIVS